MSRKYPEENKKHPKRVSPSIKLRKYGIVYNYYIRKSQQSNITKSPRRPRQDKTHRIHNPKNKHTEKKQTNTPKSKRKSLNPYQKFVKNESKKEKYKKMPGKQRLSIIADEWNKKNNK